MKSTALISLVVLSACASLGGRGGLGRLIVADATNTRACPDAKPGEACRLSQRQAEQFCAAMGMHLPTSREFAAYAVSKGAKGLIEKPAGAVPEGYYLVASVNPGNQRDDFYFNHAGYNVERGAMKGEMIWTASVVPGKEGYAHVFYGDWGGGGGKPEEHLRTYRNTVRCVK